MSLYAQSDTLLVAAVLKSCCNKCLEIYKLNPTQLFSTPKSVQQECLKKTGVEMKLITNIDMVLMIEKGIRVGICHVISRYAKVNNKYMKLYTKDKELLCLMSCDLNDLCGWAISQKLLANIF